MNSLKDTKQSSPKTGSFVISEIKQRITAPIIKLSAICAALLLTVLLYKSGIGCVWRYFLHVPCPGCGMTSALLSALRGDFHGMITHHFMAPSLPVILVYILCDGRVFRRKWIDYTILGIIGAGFLVQWIMRFV